MPFVLVIGRIESFGDGAALRSAILTVMSLALWERIIRARISLRVFLRLTAMDVCCGPPLPSLL